MSKQYLDKEGLQIVVNKVNEAREVGAGAMALAQEVSETSTIAFTGTFAEWNSLSASEKAKFAGHIVNITDDASNVQNAVRNPDWSRVIQIPRTTIQSPSSGYVCPEDGIIIVTYFIAADDNAMGRNVYINDVKVAAAYSNDTNLDIRNSTCQIPVGKGDVVTADAETQFLNDAIKFVPYKTTVIDNRFPTNYSASEQFTGKYWIDGKKIYCRVFTGTNDTPVTQNSRDAFNEDIVISGGVDTLITCNGSVSCYRSGETNPYITQNFFSAMIDQDMGIYWGGRVFKSNTGLNQTFYSRANTFVKIDYSTVYEYTKITD